MDIVRSVGQCNQAANEHAVTIGAYDGVHRGHQSVIAKTRNEAGRLGVQMAVVTFDPHPAEVLRPGTAPKLLTRLDQKLELLAAAGVDTAMVVPFDKRQAAESAESFVSDVLVACLQAKLVVVGHDFHFGVKRSGNVAVLEKLGAEHGFTVEGLQLMDRSDGPVEPVSSTAIRRALAGGNVKIAGGMLGRSHELRGVVTTGDQRGRSIGFPTANIAVDQRLAVPADAVYAGRFVRADGSVWPCAINVGKRPTFYRNAKHSLVEAHVIGFEGNLYDEQVRVQFVELLRSEQRFDGVEALKAQLQLDVARASKVLENVK